MLNVAVRAARAAGAIINRAALDVEAVRVAQKQANDFVTEVDQASEAAIIETLLTAYPGHGILAEESGRAHGDAHSEHIWIIDPLDGTTNFIHGFPVYCVSIALQVAGRIEQAVVYDPTRNDLFTATRGRGAFLNDRRIRVSKRLYLSDCLIATGFPYRPGDDVPTYLEMMGAMMRATAGLRRPGSAALDLAYVAAGFSDGFFETGLKPWDMAAGSLLVTEAGGLIGNFTGDALQLDMPECLTANPRVYAQMVKLLAQYSRAGQVPAPQPAAGEPPPQPAADEREDEDEDEGKGENPPPAPESISDEATAQPVPVVNPEPSETPAATDATPPMETADAPPRPRLRAAPRRAPEPEDAPEPRYRRPDSAGPRPGYRDNTEKFARPRQPAQGAGRDRPYGRPGAGPAGKFGPKNTGGRPAFGDRPAFQNRQDRSDWRRPMSDDRWSDRADRYSAGPRRADDPPRGRPAFGERPAFQNRPDRGRPMSGDRWNDRADRYSGDAPRRADGPPRGRPAFGDRPAFNNRPGRSAPPRPMSGDRRDSRADRYPASPRRSDSGAPRGKPYTPRAPRSGR